MSKVIHLTKDNFEAEVLQAHGKVLVDFWADWCGPCRMLAPALEAIAAEDHDGIKIGKVNVDEQSDLARKYNIMSIPALKVFDDGQIVAEQVGAVPRPTLNKLLGI